MELFKSILRAKRKDIALRQCDMAKQLGVSTKTVSDWELGVIPNFFSVDALADLFGCSVDELVGREYKYTPPKKMREFKNILYGKMLEHNYTYDGLAKSSGVDDNTIRQWTSGKNFPNLKYLCKLSDVFQCSIDELMGRKL